MDIDDDMVVEVDLGIVLTAGGKPGNLFQGKLEVGAFSFVGLLDSTDFFTKDESAGKGLLLGLVVCFVVIGCGCSWDEMDEVDD